jgi:gamma-butyrobetaine dioxygenase/trimethyllysine dioxygenase
MPPTLRPSLDALRVESTELVASFHWFWLRHQCPCCVHPVTRERILDGAAIDLDLAPRTWRSLPEGLLVCWSDGHESTFPWSFLRDHAYGTAPDRVAATVGEVTVAPGAQAADQMLQHVAAHGWSVLRGAGTDTEALIDAFGAQGLEVVPTHFGRIEDLRVDNTTNENTDQLGYTDAAIDLHTDQPFLDHPPRYQLLHAIVPADEGGENTIADVQVAVERLRERDRPALQRLAATRVRFHRRQRAFERIVDAPIVTLDGDGRLVQVRHSYFTYAPFRMPFAEMRSFYEAYQAFDRAVRDPDVVRTLRLEAGDAILYDNRCLHGRRAFRGARWLRGVYFSHRGE